jgi:rhodanese-related sulfurtransferase
MFVKEIDAAELSRRMEQQDIHLVDIRNSSEVIHGVIPNYIHLPMHLIPIRMSELPKDKEVVLYCRSGARSYQACMFLAQQGFTNVVNLRGGIISWAQNGLQIVAPNA